MGVSHHGPARGLGVSSAHRTFSPLHCLFQEGHLAQSLWTVVFLPLKCPARSSVPMLVRRDRVTATWFKQDPKRGFWALVDQSEPALVTQQLQEPLPPLIYQPELQDPGDSPVPPPAIPHTVRSLVLHRSCLGSSTGLPCWALQFCCLQDTGMKSKSETPLTPL